LSVKKTRLEPINSPHRSATRTAVELVSPGAPLRRAKVRKLARGTRQDAQAVWLSGPLETSCGAGVRSCSCTALFRGWGAVRAAAAAAEVHAAEHRGPFGKAPVNFKGGGPKEPRQPQIVHQGSCRGGIFIQAVYFAWEISCFKLTTKFTTQILEVSPKFPTLVVGTTNFSLAPLAPLCSLCILSGSVSQVFLRCCWQSVCLSRPLISVVVWRELHAPYVHRASFDICVFMGTVSSPLPSSKAVLVALAAVLAPGGPSSDRP